MMAAAPTINRAMVGPDPKSPSAQRFAKSMANDCASFALTITGGLHIGASVRSRRCMTVGASIEDDLMLRDPGVQPGHAEIARLNDVWAVLRSVDGSTRALAPVESVRRGHFLRQRYQIGEASFILTQIVRLKVAPVRPQRSWLTPVMVSVLGGATLIAVVMMFAMQPAGGPAIEPPDARTLATRGWPDVQVLPVPGGGYRVNGYVEDAEQLERLRKWLDAQPLGPLDWRVRSGVDSVALVRQALGSEEVSVRYAGAGRVRVQGTISDMSVRQRLSVVATDLAGIVQVEDRLAVIDAKVIEPRARALPFKILDVVPGENGYFRTDTGARYFVGATLNDGAEVVSISSDAIEFRNGDRQVFYPLK